MIHPIPPLFDENSKILILGSFPSVSSREAMFFYAHPQNRFWRVIAAVLGESVPAAVEEKKALLLAHGVALWDVIGACEIEGSADASIKNAAVNDLSPILNGCMIRRIYTNGSTAGRLYRRYLEPVTGVPAATLPSTSPANAAWSLERLIGAWRVILEPGRE